MFAPHIPRLRAAIILALAVFVWSDAALASFVCPRMSGCKHGMPASGNSNAGAQDATGEAMACCPVKPKSSVECDDSPMQCCTWHRDSEVAAILFASDHPRPKQIAAALSVAPAAPDLTARAHVAGLADDLTYVKPVIQKKTDLRI